MNQTTTGPVTTAAARCDGAAPCPAATRTAGDPTARLIGGLR
ncbi:hypothetical protein ACLTEW_01190 [Gordonia lacunae]|nr:hypothetical protein [Gordonia lacunae]